MAHLNDADATHHRTSIPCPSTPRRSRTPVFGRVSVEAPETPVNARKRYVQRDCTSGSPTKHEGSPWSTPLGTLDSDEARIQGNVQITPSKRFWSVVGPCEKPCSSRIRSQPLPRQRGASEDLKVTPARGNYECRPSAPTLIWNGQPTTSPSRARTPRSSRYFPYEAPHVHSNRYTNAEAGPSNMGPPRTPSVTMSPANPPGGLSEATAGAKHNQTSTEENAVPMTPHRTPKKTPSKPSRYDEGLTALCAWAEKWKKLPRLPTQLQALHIALEVVKTLRPTPVYAVPRLKRGPSRTVQGGGVQSRKTANETIRRTQHRDIHEELSKYYVLPEGRKEFSCPDIMVRVLRDIESLEKPPAE